jgi:hypothetical protein
MRFLIKYSSAVAFAIALTSGIICGAQWKYSLYQSRSKIMEDAILRQQEMIENRNQSLDRSLVLIRALIEDRKAKEKQINELLKEIESLSAI